MNVLETSKLRIREHYLYSVSYVLLHFLTLRLFENLAPECADRLAGYQGFVKELQISASVGCIFHYVYKASINLLIFLLK